MGCSSQDSGERSHKKKETLLFVFAGRCLLEGQEARPGEQHVGAAAGVFGSVEHTKVIRARASRRVGGVGGRRSVGCVRMTVWGMPRLNSKPWYGTETLSATTDYRCHSKIISREVSETASPPVSALAVDNFLFGKKNNNNKKAAGAERRDASW